MTQTRSISARPRVGISSCLLGERVRYDGGHKKDAFLTERLGTVVEWVPVCPEIEIGLGTPREAIRLVQIEAHLRLVGVESGSDHTEAMEQFSRRRVLELRAFSLSGYVLKSKSPSCGMERVEVYDAQGVARREGRGLFARTLLEAMPHLPIEDERRLADPRLRATWIERVFAYHAAL